jgi:hypothetical protein
VPGVRRVAADEQDEAGARDDDHLGGLQPEWKITLGGSLDYDREEFDLDEEEAFRSVHRERELQALVVRGLGEHWSVGAKGELRSSTFDNEAFHVAVAPAVEWNFFPYSDYTRRQFRTQYAIGRTRSRYHEETLFGKTEEGRWLQEASATYEQREPWGSIGARLEWSNFLPGFSQHRLELDSDISVRVVRGLSLSFEAGASRIRDQIGLPKRDATAEEVLLRIRRLQSGYSVRFEFGVTYQFGSIFRSIVNPRFGQ